MLHRQKHTSVWQTRTVYTHASAQRHTLPIKSAQSSVFSLVTTQKNLPPPHIHVNKHILYRAVRDLQNWDSGMKIKPLRLRKWYKALGGERETERERAVNTQLQNRKTPSFSKGKGQTKQCALLAFSTVCQRSQKLSQLWLHFQQDQDLSQFSFNRLQPAGPLMGNIQSKTENQVAV